MSTPALRKTKEPTVRYGYYTTLRSAAKKLNQAEFDTGANHPGHKKDRLLDKYYHSEEPLTQEEKEQVAQLIAEDARDAGESAPVESSRCNKTLRDKCVNHFLEKSEEIQELAAELEEKYEQFFKEEDIQNLSDDEIVQLKKLISTNGGMVSPEIIKSITESIIAKRVPKERKGLYERMAMNYYYYGSKVAAGAVTNYSKLLKNVAAPCAGAVVESAKTAATGVGVMAASVFVRDQILPMLFSHVLPTVAEYMYGPGSNTTMTNTTGMDPNVTMGMGGGRKKGRKTHKKGKRSGRHGKTHRRR